MDIFDHIDNFDGDLHRNIVSLRESEDLFDDLSDGDPELSAVAVDAEMRIKQDIPKGFVERGFHYTLAIGYPFETEPFMSTRFSDGRYGVWYGSLDLETTVFETAYHTKKDILNIIGIQEKVARERAVYLVHCQALLVDLRGKADSCPDLIDDDYSFCQQVGSRLYREGHPGLLTPSARSAGDNAVVFNPAVLRDPRLTCSLTYIFDPLSGKITVEKAPGETLLTID